MGELILPGDPRFLNAQKVNELHAYSDLNRAATSQHHTLGDGPLEAAPGNHKHANAASAVAYPLAQIIGGNPYVSTTISNTYVYLLGNSTGPPLKLITMAQLLNAAPGSQRIHFTGLPRPSHDTVSVRYEHVSLSGIGTYGFVWSPSESLWFLADAAGGQVSGGWAANTLLTAAIVGQFQ